MPVHTRSQRTSAKLGEVCPGRKGSGFQYLPCKCNDTRCSKQRVIKEGHHDGSIQWNVAAALYHWILFHTRRSISASVAWESPFRLSMKKFSTFSVVKSTIWTREEARSWSSVDASGRNVTITALFPRGQTRAGSMSCQRGESR